MPPVITEYQTYDYKVAFPSPVPNLTLQHHFGFDAEKKYQRLAIGQRRLLSTKGGPVAGMKFAITGTQNCKIVSQDVSTAGPGGNKGLVVIEGVAQGGGGKLELQSAAGKPVDAIDLDVGKFVGTSVRFYNLIDGKGRKAVAIPAFGSVPAAFLPVALGALVDAVNGIVLTQADALLSMSGDGALRDLSTIQDFGNRVDINKLNIFSFSGMDGSAGYHVIFVWGIDGGHTNGITRSNVTLLDVSLAENKRPLTLAHEFVHFLSASGIVTVNDHDNQPGDLMFKTFPHGIKMRKERLQKIHVGQL